MIAGNLYNLIKVKFDIKILEYEAKNYCRRIKKRDKHHCRMIFGCRKIIDGNDKYEFEKDLYIGDGIYRPAYSMYGCQ
jgi:hypothetical protein